MWQARYIRSQGDPQNASTGGKGIVARSDADDSHCTGSRACVSKEASTRQEWLCSRYAEEIATRQHSPESGAVLTQFLIRSRFWGRTVQCVRIPGATQAIRSDIDFASQFLQPASPTGIVNSKSVRASAHKPAGNHAVFENVKSDTDSNSSWQHGRPGALGGRGSVASGVGNVPGPVSNSCDTHDGCLAIQHKVLQPSASNEL